MKFFDKLGLALFSIIVLIISIILCLIGFNVMDPTIFTILISKVLISQTYTTIMIVSSLLLLLLAVKCIFFSGVDNVEESNDGILLQNGDGKLLITVETIKNMVEGTVKEFSSIVNSKTRVIVTKENDVIINVSIDVAKGTVIKDVSSKLQTQIKKSIKEATDLEIKCVNIEVINAQREPVKVEETKVVKEVKSNTKELKDTKEVKSNKSTKEAKSEVKK